MVLEKTRKEHAKRKRAVNVHFFKSGGRGGAFHFVGFSFLILILLLICTQEGDEIKIKIRSEIKRGTQKCEMHRRPLLPRK